MTFIDISYHLAVEATYTNRKCNIFDFGGPISGFEKILLAHLIGHPQLVGGLFYDFYSYLLPLGRNGRLHKPEMQYLGFWGQGRTSQKLLGVQETTFSVVLDNSEYI